MKEQLKNNSVKIGIAAVLFLAAALLLREDFPTFLIWWAVIWVMGCTFMPVTSILFPTFRDRGWMFSKVISIAVCGYLTWLLVVLKFLPFTTLTCMVVTVVCLAVNLWLALRIRRNKQDIWPGEGGELIFLEEVIFFIAFLVWTYLAGFHPAAHGTEKFMDFGFMQAMMKSETLPAVDLWYSQKTINYYYGGQYYAVFLTKLTTTSVEITYNLMRTLVAGFAFVLPFSLVYHMISDRNAENGGMEEDKKQLPAILGGLLAGGAVSISGNMHYIIYSKIIPLKEILTDAEEVSPSYWFPDATRYIGHDPETMDRCIHEFPCYSFVLGDLHAHVVNVFFVLTVTAFLYGWLKQNKGKSWCQPVVFASGFFLGIFQFSNTWDFVIYYVVICGTLFFGNLYRYREKIRLGFGWSAVQWLEILLLSMVVALPFNLDFDSSMAQGVVLSENHSAFYQLCILWGLPFVVGIAYLAFYLWGLRGQLPCRGEQTLSMQDLFTGILTLCAMGLVVIPEIVYVKDIYEKTSARSNTMFKLTYQAYILFGIAMAYILVRFLQNRKNQVLRGFAMVMTALLVSTFGYFINASKSWFGNVFDHSGYQTLDATLFLEHDIPDDASAIRWLNDNIEGRPVVLEANGNSYTDYERVSAMTGLPTVLGWYTHQWLWRNDTDDLNAIAADIETIYTSADEELVRSLLTQYDVSYIFIGSCEREKYPDINEGLLYSLGEIVFDEAAAIVKVQ